MFSFVTTFYESWEGNFQCKKLENGKSEEYDITLTFYTEFSSVFTCPPLRPASSCETQVLKPVDLVNLAGADALVDDVHHEHGGGGMAELRIL